MALCAPSSLLQSRLEVLPPIGKLNAQWSEAPTAVIGELRLLLVILGITVVIGAEKARHPPVVGLRVKIAVQVSHLRSGQRRSPEVWSEQ